VASRRVARERALQALYQQEMAGTAPGTDALFWRHFDPDEEAGEFARELVAGVAAERAAIDERIGAALEHWQIERLSRVDLCLLRLATYELAGRPEIPFTVTINEAVDIARRYGSAESPAFVNGVLDRIAAALGLKAAAEEGR
jgi:N utilization substance protein B